MLALAPTACRRDDPLHSAVLPQPVSAGEATAAVRPLRVLFCTDNFGIGGTELNAVRTAEALVRRGVELEVAGLQADGPLRARYDAAGIPVHSFPLANLYGPGALRQGIRLAVLVRKGEFDVIHCHDIYTNIFAGFWARRGGASAVIASRRWGLDSTQGRLDQINRLAQRRSSRVLANSNEVAAMVRDDGVQPQRVAVIPNFLEADAFVPPPASEVAAWRSARGIPEGAALLGIVARLAPVKNHPSLFRALASIAPRFPSLHLAVIGDGPLRSGLEAMARDLGLDDRIHFLGMVPHRPNVNHYLDLVVLSSVSEGFPNTIAEAMAAGRSVVATAVGGVSDVVLDGETGVLVAAADDTALAEALAARLADAAGTARMGLRAREVASTRFAEDVVLSRLMALYEELKR
ncbi:MAG TPA: glycosyltransferase [Gemmatimonadales bacterium]|nr:glycosyltransferase [Gemmatimonadales bacterium]